MRQPSGFQAQRKSYNDFSNMNASQNSSQRLSGSNLQQSKVFKVYNMTEDGVVTELSQSSISSPEASPEKA